MSEPPEELIKLKAYQIWEKRQQTDKKGENPQSDWEKAEQYFKKHRWKVFLWKLARTLSNRPIRKFADFWEKAPIEKFFLEDIKYLLDKSALVSIITVLTEISIIFSLISWTIDREERKTNEIFSTWIIVKEAEGNQSGILRLALERLLKNNFSLVGINLNNTNLECSNLKGANLEGNELKGANLEGVNLKGANLSNTILSSTNLKNANLGSSRQIFKKSKLNTNLSSANLEDANLQGANLEDANLQGANLRKTILFKASLKGANLTDVDFKRANLEEADLQESFTSTRNKHNSYYVLESNFQEARLLKANFKKTRFSGFVYANFKNAWVSGADFSEAYLHGNFENAILRSTIFKNAILDFTSFKNANLRGADFTNATLNESIFENALMINASFVGVKRLDTETIISACFWDKAIYKKNETENLEYIKELKENTAYNSEEEKTRCHNWTRDPIYIFDNPFPLQWEPFWETEFEASIEGKKHLFSHYEQIKRNEDIKKCVSKNEFNYWKLLEAVILLSIIVFNLWLLGIFRWCIKKVML